MIYDFLHISYKVLEILTFFTAIFILYYERKNPAVIWAWLMLFTLIPAGGVVLYFLIGFEGRKHTIFYKKSHKDEEIFESYYEKIYLKTVKEKPVYIEDKKEHFNDMVFLNKKTGKTYATTNNKVVAFYNGEDKFNSLVEDIRNAKKYIHLEYYIIRNDSLAERLVEELTIKAKEGVKVKILYDGIANFLTPKKLFRPLIEAGGKVAVFLPPYFIRINYRNHRKIAVIDGEVGYIGGFNIGNEYLGKVKRFGNWRDTHIRIEGDSVKDIEYRFFTDYAHTAKLKNTEINPWYFPEITEKKGDTPVQILSSGPDTKLDSIRLACFKMINEADKRVFIQTPYFVPDESIFDALKTAALSGVDVRIVIPANPDHIFVYNASLSYLGELLKAGVKCYKYEKGFIHSKVLTIDSLISTVGTANMDVRSFKLNFEINAFIYDESVTEKLDEQFIKDLDDCTEITYEWYLNRGKFARVKESVARLISPLL